MKTQHLQSLNENQIGTIVIDCCLAIHKELGPGLLETVYEAVLCYELEQQGLNVQRQVSIPVTYKDVTLEEGFRADIIVEEKVLLELKSVEKICESHKKQVQTYMRLMGLRLGYLLNFREALMKTGITRCVNRL